MFNFKLSTYMFYYLCLFVCLECFVPLETFYSFGDVTVTGEGFGVRIPAATDLSRKNR